MDNYEKNKNYFKTLTPGKLLGLSKITNDKGQFKVLALDQNNSFKKALTKMFEQESNPHNPTGEEITQTKMAITAVLSPYATAVLLDVSYGLGQAVASGSLHRNSALIGRLEASTDPGIPAQIEANWSVQKIKKMGCNAVKLLLYMDTKNVQFTQKQMEFLYSIERECQKEDILLMVEELTFPLPNEDKDSDEYKARKSENIIQSAKIIGPHCDILKLEYPGSDRVKELNEVASRPWVLLSAGQPYDQFRSQVEQSMSSGASGIMAGRAIFNDYFAIKDFKEREKFLVTTAVQRMQELGEIVENKAVGWLDRYSLSSADLKANLSADWYGGAKQQDSNNGEY